MRRNRYRRLYRWLKRGLGLGLGASGLLLIARSLMPDPLLVDLAEVARGAMEVTVDEDGKARVKDRYVVSAPIGGQLGRIELEAGDDVQEGDVVARIVPLEPPLLDERSRSAAEARVAAGLAARQRATAQIERAQAELTFAKGEITRYERLATQRVVSQQRLEQSRLQLRTASANLESARFAQRVAEHELGMARAALGRLGRLGRGRDPLEALEVPAPVSGRVLQVLRESEGAIPSGAPLLEIGDPTALEIVVDVLTQDAVEIRAGAKATIDRWGGPPLEARVRRVEPSAFTRMSSLGVEEQRVNVVLDLVEEPKVWAALGDGYRIEAHITVWQRSDVIKVPASSVFRNDGGWAVFRVDGKVAHRVPVEIGRRTGREVEILRGLEAQAVVVVHPSDKVQPGVSVLSRDNSANAVGEVKTKQ